MCSFGVELHVYRRAIGLFSRGLLRIRHDCSQNRSTALVMGTAGRFHGSGFVVLIMLLFLALRPDLLLLDGNVEHNSDPAFLLPSPSSNC